jgi:hypothetical protein
MPIVNLLTVRSWWDWHNSTFIPLVCAAPKTVADHLLGAQVGLDVRHFSKFLHVLFLMILQSDPRVGNDWFSNAGRQSNRRPSASRYAESYWRLFCCRLYLPAYIASCTDLLDRCQPREGAADMSPYGLVSVDVCTSANHERLKDGFRSFFSGHSSCA